MYLATRLTVKDPALPNIMLYVASARGKMLGSFLLASMSMGAKLTACFVEASKLRRVSALLDYVMSIEYGE